jgi:hypothetical protein
MLIAVNAFHFPHRILLVGEKGIGKKDIAEQYHRFTRTPFFLPGKNLSQILLDEMAFIIPVDTDTRFDSIDTQIENVWVIPVIRNSTGQKDTYVHDKTPLHFISWIVQHISP